MPILKSWQNNFILTHSPLNCNKFWIFCAPVKPPIRKYAELSLNILFRFTKHYTDFFQNNYRQGRIRGLIFTTITSPTTSKIWFSHSLDPLMQKISAFMHHIHTIRCAAYLKITMVIISKCHHIFNNNNNSLLMLLKKIVLTYVIMLTKIFILALPVP